MSTAKPIVDAEFAALLPQLSGEEFAGLEQKLLAEGCTEKLTLWKGHDILVDGHNRYTICQKHDLSFTVREMEFSDRAAVIDWMITTQLARRNLTDEQRTYYIGKKLLAVPDGREGSRSDSERATAPKTTAAQKIADQEGVDVATVYRAAEFAEAVDTIAEVAPDKKEKILRPKNGKPKPSRKKIAKAAKAAKEIICDRCKRVGKTEGCQACEVMQRQAIEKVTDDANKDAEGIPDAIVDDSGTVVPASMRNVFAHVDAYRKAELLLAKASKEIKEVEKLHSYKQSDKSNDKALGDKYVYSTVLFAGSNKMKLLRPSMVCGECLGKKCDKCNGKGFLTVLEAKATKK